MMSPKTGKCRPIVAVGTLVWLFATASCPSLTAAAEPAITWNAPEECPNQDEITMRAQRLIGAEVKSPVVAHVQVDRLATGYRAHMQLETAAGTGSRVLEDTRCDRLADGVALVYALSAPDAARVEPERARWSLAAYGGAVLGPLPELAAGVAAALAVEWRRLRLELTGSYHLPQTKPFGDGVLAGRLQLMAAGLRGGLFVPLGRLELAPSLGVRLHAFTVAGEGGEYSRSVRVTSWGPALAVLVRVRLADHWALGLAAEGCWLLQRPRFVFSDAGSLHQPTTLELGLWLGTEVRL